MLIAWKDAFSIDGGAIDEDHRFLIDLINHMIGDVTTNDYNPLRADFSHLRSYAAQHFLREETLPKAGGYLGYGEHRREHEDSLIQLDRFVELLMNARYGAINADGARGKLHSFLYRWLLCHILYNDLRMRPYVQNVASGEESGTVMPGVIESGSGSVLVSTYVCRPRQLNSMLRDGHG